MLRGGSETLDMDSYLQNYSLAAPTQTFKHGELSAAGAFSGSILLGDEVDEWISTPFGTASEPHGKSEAFNAPIVAHQVPFKFSSSPISCNIGGSPWQTAVPMRDALVASPGNLMNDASSKSVRQPDGSPSAAPDTAYMGDAPYNASPPANSGGNSANNEVIYKHHSAMMADSGFGKKPGLEKAMKPVNRSHLTQRRYRERQKAKTADLESTVQQLKEENRVLLEERTNLLGRNSVLLQLLEQRDKHIADVHAKVNVEHPKSPGTARASMDGREQNGNDLAQAFSGSLTLTLQEDTPIELGPEQVKLLSQEELARLWRDYVNKLALLLVAADSRPMQSHLVQRIEQLTKEAGFLITRVTVRNPLGVKNFVARKLEDDRSVLSREETSEVWMQTAARLSLTGEQKESIRQLRSAYVERLGQMLQARKETLQCLMDHLPSPLSTRITAANFVKSSNVVKQLEQSMDEETSMVVDFIRALYEQIFTPMQRARYIVGSYPWTPDHLAFATAVAAELGDASAREVLCQLHLPTRSPSESSC